LEIYLPDIKYQKFRKIPMFIDKRLVVIRSMGSRQYLQAQIHLVGSFWFFVLTRNYLFSYVARCIRV
jgi:hypothetical protein